MAVGDRVCYTGYVMDSYCISRGNLFDNPSKSTLLHPHLHSLHCLVDPPQCTPESGGVYELLSLVSEDDGKGAKAHCRAFGLGAEASKAMLKFARAAGAKGGCSTCTNSSAAAPSAGFAATVTGTIADASASPNVLAGVVVHHAAASCASLVGHNASVPAAPNFGSGNKMPAIRAHAMCMLLSWGLLLPGGVLTARFLRHRPNGAWFKAHRAVQLSGLLLALLGWSIALANFDVFTGPTSVSTIHGSIGMVVMTLGLLQPINAFFRPKPPEDKTDARVAWERLHKGSGRTAVVLGLLNALIGVAVLAPGARAIFGVFVALLKGLYKYYSGTRISASGLASRSAASSVCSCS